MEFYLTPAATTYFNFPVKQTIEIVKERMKKGFFPWLLNPFKRIYDVDAQFELPVFFVCEEDLGTSMPIHDWQICKEEDYVRATDISVAEKSAFLNLPELVSIPDAHKFDYERNGRLINPEILDSQNSEGQPGLRIEKQEGSFDWLGLYYGFRASLRCIFIRIEKIMLEKKGLANPFGVASIVIHELAHALMDSPLAEDLLFTMPVDPDLAASLGYYMEEAMANLIAYRSIRGRDVSRGTVADIAQFMKHQPFPYALGLRMGEAERTMYSSLDFIIKSYVLKWYNAKNLERKLGIGNCNEWFRMVFDENQFRDTDLKTQYDILFVKI